MINILLISITSSIGGGPAHIFSIIKNLDRSKFHIFVAAPNDGEYFEKFKQEADTFDINLRSDYLGNLRRLKKIINDNKIQICHSHGRGAGVYSRPLKMICPQLVVIHTFHGIHFENRSLFGKLFVLETERILKYWTDENIAVSKKEYEEAIRLRLSKRNRTKLIYNGIDINRFDIITDSSPILKSLGINKDKSTYIIGCFGRLDFAKGQIDLVRAFKKFNDVFSDSFLLLVGEGPEKEHIINEINYLKLEEKVLLVGFRNDIPELMHCIDLYVSSSLKEGLPYTLIEALASQTLVVATKTTGNDEIIFEGETGVLCEVNNPDSLFLAMKEMKESYLKYEYYRKNGMELVKNNFDINDMIVKLSNIYLSHIEV